MKNSHKILEMKKNHKNSNRKGIINDLHLHIPMIELSILS